MSSHCWSHFRFPHLVVQVRAGVLGWQPAPTPVGRQHRPGLSAGSSGGVAGPAGGSAESFAGSDVLMYPVGSGTPRCHALQPPCLPCAGRGEQVLCWVLVSEPCSRAGCRPWPASLPDSWLGPFGFFDSGDSLVLPALLPGLRLALAWQLKSTCCFV